MPYEILESQSNCGKSAIGLFSLAGKTVREHRTCKSHRFQLGGAS
jgi:hypothetical protein